MSKNDKQVHARDIMHTDLIRLEPDESLEGAIATLEDAHISGAPVVDAADRLVGVFTLRDAARSEVEGRGSFGQRDLDASVPDWSADDLDDGIAVESEISARDDYSSSTGGGESVGDWMSPGLISVPPAATLQEVCAVMAREKIHRVFVVDGKRLLGVISSLDVVAHVAEA
jgi:CBS domain-containing protein